MTIRVLLFAGLAERAGAREWRIDDLPPLSTVAALLASLRSRHRFLDGAPFVVARNRDLVAADASLHDGDELALLPPVSGG